MAVLSQLQNVNVGGVMQHRTQNLGEDLMKLFDSSARAVKTYDTIGITSAKLQASEDARLYNEQISAVKSALAYADKDPDMYVNVKQRVEELSQEFVAKREIFKDHKAAYDAYSEFALDVTSNQRVSFEPVFTKGFLLSSQNRFNEETRDKSILSGINVAEADRNIAVQVGTKLGLSVPSIEQTITKPHLSTMDEQINGVSPEFLLSDIKTHDDAVNFLNTMTGSIGKYVKDEETQNVSFSSKIETPEIQEQYMDRYRTFIAKIPKQSQYNPDYANVMDKTSDLSAIKSLKENEDDINKAKTAIDDFQNSIGYKILTPEQKANYAFRLKDLETKSRIASALSNAIQTGENPISVQYKGVTTKVKDGEIILVEDDSFSLLRQDEINSFVNGEKNSLVSKIKHMSEITETDIAGMNALLRVNSQITKEVSTDLMGAFFVTQPSNIVEVEGMSKILTTLGGRGSNLPASIKQMYVNASGVINEGLERFNKEGLTEKQKEKIGEELVEIAGYQLKSIAERDSLNIKLSNNGFDMIKDSIDINGFFNQKGITDDDAISKIIYDAREAVTTDRNPNPSNKEIIEFINNNATNIEEWFSKDYGADGFVLPPRDRNGNLIPQNIFVAGVKMLMLEYSKGTSLDNFKIENASMYGNNNVIAIKSKLNNEIVHIITGQDFIERMQDINNFLEDGRSSIKKPITPAQVEKNIQKINEAQANFEQYGTKE